MTHSAHLLEQRPGSDKWHCVGCNLTAASLSKKAILSPERRFAVVVLKP